MIFALAEPGEEDPRRITVWALDARNVSFERSAGTVREGQKFYAIPYSASVEDLELTPGLIEPDLSTPRPLPEEYLDFFDAELEPGPLRWVSISEIPEGLRNYPFPRFDGARCLSRGRCLSTIDRGRNDVRCIACERPEILPPEPPAPPLLPSPPQFFCPVGWVRAGDGCEPGKKPAPVLECPIGQMQRYLERSCAPVGRACPVGQWSLEKGAYFVIAGGTPGGSGTIADPYRTLAYASSAAPVGSTLALSSETYFEEVAIDRPLRLVGACPERTRLAGGPGFAAIRVSAAGVIIENLGVDRSALHGIHVQAGARAIVEGVELIGDRGGAGVLIDAGASVRIASSRLRGWHSGVNASAGGRVELEDAVVERSRAAGIAGGPGGVLIAERVAVRDTLGAGISDGIAIFATGDTVSLSGVEVVRCRYGGIVIYNAYASISDAFVSEVEQDRKSRIGAGLIANGAPISVRRMWVDRPAVSGVHLARLTGSVEDLVVDRPGRGHNIEIHAGARVTLDRLRLTGVSEHGVLIGFEGLPPPQVIARDVVIEGSRHADRAGVGVRVARGSLELSRARIIDSLGAGIKVHPGQIFSGRDLHIFGVRANAEDGGHALIGGARSSVSLERARFSDTLSPMLFFHGGARTATVTDLTAGGVADTRSGYFSAGIALQADRANLRRIAIDDVAHFGLLIFGSGASVKVEDLSVRRVGPRPSDSSEAPRGGIGIFETGEVALHRIDVRDLDGEGLRVFERASVELTDFRSEATKGVGLRLFAGEVIGRRIHISEAQNEAILLAPLAIEAPTPRELDLEHVLIDRPGEEVGSRSAMIKVGIGARLRMESFELFATGRGTSVLVEQPAVLELSGGLIHARPESVDLSTRDEKKKTDALQAVRFEDQAD